MSYRNDEDAALARADALQQDLDAARGELAEMKEKLAAASIPVSYPLPSPASLSVVRVEVARDDSTMWAGFVTAIVFVVAVCVTVCVGR
ncbi:MAG TPA: hypothetical protein VGM39_02545 [Kofleriaceae bacterium]|jgi:hypothetical protein